MDLFPRPISQDLKRHLSATDALGLGHGIYHVAVLTLKVTSDLYRFGHVTPLLNKKTRHWAGLNASLAADERSWLLVVAGNGADNAEGPQQRLNGFDSWVLNHALSDLYQGRVRDAGFNRQLAKLAASGLDLLANGLCK